MVGPILNSVSIVLRTETVVTVLGSGYGIVLNLHLLPFMSNKQAKHRRYVNTVTGPPSHSAPLQLATPDPSTHKINQNGNFIFTTRRRRKAQLGFLAVFGYFQFAGLGCARLSALLWAGPVPGCGCEV